MSSAPFNVHATAIVLGTRGLLFVGPSGCGKTTLALSAIDGAHRSRQYAALVSDDQVMITVASGRFIARAPDTIRGLVEIRGAGIVRVETIDAAVIDLAVLPVSAPFDMRLPEAAETFQLKDNLCLPLIRLPFGESRDPFAILSRLIPQSGEF